MMDMDGKLINYRRPVNCRIKMQKYNRTLLKKNTIAVAMIVKNESKHLSECINTFKDWVDEIVILDSGSTDDTRDIAGKFTDNVHTNEFWQGFGPQRRLAQTHIHSDYVLWLDADERVTPELRESIEQALQHPEKNTVYSIPRLSWAFGKFIRHCGWYPDRVIRLYPTMLTQYDESLVHEKVIINDGMMVRKLKGNFIHYPYDDLNHYLIKSARYAKAWADQKEKAGEKTTITQSILHSLARFLNIYIIKGGFLDGKQGLLLSLLSMYSTFIKYADLWVRLHTRPSPSNTTKKL